VRDGDGDGTLASSFRLIHSFSRIFCLRLTPVDILHILRTNVEDLQCMISTTAVPIGTATVRVKQQPTTYNVNGSLVMVQKRIKQA
jgi:hypothetical protein